MGAATLLSDLTSAGGAFCLLATHEYRAFITSWSHGIPRIRERERWEVC